MMFQVSGGEKVQANQNTLCASGIMCIMSIIIVSQEENYNNIIVPNSLNNFLINFHLPNVHR